MVNWLKVIAVIIALAFVYFGGYEAWHLYTLPFAVFLLFIVVILAFFLDKINWSVFRKEREILSCEEWAPRAVAALKRNNPDWFRDKKFEAEILRSIPIGIVWVYSLGALEDDKKCAFGEVWKDSQNFIISPLARLNWHERTNVVLGKEAVGLKYLKKTDLRPESILKKVEPKAEVDINA